MVTRKSSKNEKGLVRTKEMKQLSLFTHPHVVKCYTMAFFEANCTIFKQHITKLETRGDSFTSLSRTKKEENIFLKLCFSSKVQS